MTQNKPLVKICGLTSQSAVNISVNAGADMLGFVFFEASPRSLSIEHAANIMRDVPKSVIKVALTVNADDALLDAVIQNTSINFVQFHGNESLARLNEIKTRHGIGIIDVIPVSSPCDLYMAKNSERIADYLMFDAKPPENATRPGGNAKSFNWTYLSGFTAKVPWILAGGLTPLNVAEAIKISGATAVDVSSGVETSLAKKDQTKILDFISEAKGN